MTASAKGAVACGHPATAAAAIEILEAGGNAFDAALAAFAAAAVAEPVLCSLGGGGFLLARPVDGGALLYDFFTETPLRKRPDPEIDFYPIVADFGTATQQFHIGAGSIATPGAVRGLFTVQRDLCRLTMSELLAPAVRLARKGVRLRPIDSYLFQVVGPILVAQPAGRALYARDDGTTLREGDMLVQTELAVSLEALSREGERLFYEGEMAQRLVAFCRDQGGHLTADDLARYRVVPRKPLQCAYRGVRILTNPPPSAGGLLVAFALRLFETLDAAALGQRTPKSLAHLGRIMELTNQARVEAKIHEARGEAEEKAAAGRLLDPNLLRRYAAQVSGVPSAPRGTTHISVVDAAGNIAALSLSNGEGCGHLLPGTGIMLNNMLGEEDVNPVGFHRWPPGSRMSSMMSPTLALWPDGAEAALGSGGSNRIRTAILQVLLNLIDFGDCVRAAVEAPRLHVERGVVNLEGGLPEEAGTSLAELATTQSISWPRHNLFFGGVHAVKRSANGDLSAAGDPRRGGVAELLA